MAVLMPKFKTRFGNPFESNELQDDQSSPYFGKPKSEMAGELISGAPGVVEAPLGGTPSRRTSRNNIGYALGRAAQGVMGEFKESPAALLGGLGAELNQDQAFKQTAKRLLAGEKLDDIPEASILSPEQLTVAVETAEKGAAGKHSREMDLLEYERKTYEFAQQYELSDKEVSARIQNYADRLGIDREGLGLERDRLDLARNTTPTVTQQNTQQEKMLRLNAKLNSDGDIARIKATIQAGGALTDIEKANLYQRVYASVYGDPNIMPEEKDSLARTAVNNILTGVGVEAMKGTVAPVETGVTIPKGTLKKTGRGFSFVTPYEEKE